MTISGRNATLAGWYTTGIGRRPWLVHGVMTTEQAVAGVPGPLVPTTLVAHLAVYAALVVADVGVLNSLAGTATRGEPVRPARRAPAPPRPRSSPTPPPPRRGHRERSDRMTLLGDPAIWLRPASRRCWGRRS